MARSRGLVWAMEEIEEQEVAAVAEEPMAVDSLETEMLDVNERTAEIEETNQAIEEAVEDTDTLEDIASVMDESTENGGMDQTSARMAEVAVESIYARLGVRKSQALPAMESFGSKGTRLTATKIAVESIGEGIKYVWEKIKAAAEKVWGWIKTFLNAIWNTAGKLKDRAAALLAKVKGLVGKKPEQQTLSLGNVGPMVAIGGKSDAPALMLGLDNLTEVAKSAEADVATLSIEMTDTDIVKAVESEDALANLTQDEVKLAGFETDGKEDEEGMVTHETKELPGGVTISITQPAKGKKGKDLLKCRGQQKVDKHANKRKRGVSKEALKDDSGDIEDVEVKTATPEEMAKVCEKVGILAKIAEASRAAMGKVSSAASSFLSLIKTIGTKIANAAKDVAGMVQRAFSAVSRSVSSFISYIYNAVVSGGKACLDWVEKHYQAYKAKKTEKATEKAAA
jgi:hypothetical protein